MARPRCQQFQEKLMPSIQVRAARADEFEVWMPLWRGCAHVHCLTHESKLDAMKLYDRIADKTGFVQYRKAIQRPCGRR
jgi:hypothetical protein